MERTFMLAERAVGQTGVNPTVGAIVVRNGRVIGEGWHRGPGSLHAEVVAIQNAIESDGESSPGPSGVGKSAGALSTAGATMYCTLEPCCHNDDDKRTPPCVPFIIKHKITRLVVACQDPNPHVDGRGIAALRHAGVQIDLLGGSAALRFCMQNEGYVSRIQRGIPFVHLKAAHSIDGRIATAAGDSRWITDTQARMEAHRLRRRYDAVLIGAGTARNDDPLLTVRHVDGRNPRAIVLSSDLRLSPDLRLFAPNRDAPATVLFCAHRYDESQQACRLRDHGVRVISVGHTEDGLNLHEILQNLAAMDIASILVEGGAKLHTAFIRSALWDRISLFIAPKLIGRGRDMIDDLGIEHIADAIVLAHARWRIIGNQALCSGYRDIQATFNRLAFAYEAE